MNPGHNFQFISFAMASKCAWSFQSTVLCSLPRATKHSTELLGGFPVSAARFQLTT